MPKSWTHSECFAFYGTTPGNPRWSWSGRSDDGSVIAVTLWQDRFIEMGKVYESWHSDMPGKWRSRPGNTELIDNLKQAKDHCDGVVHVILAKARDIAAVPRSIERCFPQENLKMRVTDLDTDEGTFRLERI